MKERKYLKQYKVNGSMDARGRTRYETEYIGEYYAFPDGTPDARARALGLLPMLTLWWALAVVYLKTARETGRCMYALLPLLMALLPSGYAAVGLFDAFGVRERLTLPQRDQSFGRVMRACAGAGILSLVGAVGCVVRVTLAGAWATAWHEVALPLGMALLAGLAFRRSKRDIEDMVIDRQTAA